MNLEQTEYRIKLNMLRIKYSRNPMEIIMLCMDSTITAVQFAKEYKFSKKLSKFEKGGITYINDKNKML